MQGIEMTHLRGHGDWRGHFTKGAGTISFRPESKKVTVKF